MAEKVLQAEIGLKKPTWLDADWYETNVVDLKGANDDKLFNGGVNSDVTQVIVEAQ